LIAKRLCGGGSGMFLTTIRFFVWFVLNIKDFKITVGKAEMAKKWFIAKIA